MLTKTKQSRIQSKQDHKNLQFTNYLDSARPIFSWYKKKFGRKEQKLK